MLIDKIKKKSEEIRKRYGTTFSFAPISATGKAALTSIAIQDVIVKESHNLGYTTLRMPSGAGHDTQEMALLGPIGMIFIPSKGGISHSPEEFSTFEQMAEGTNVLLNSILRLDKTNIISD
jgi:N-carbamoyl-L-amino-acid hydrolase